MSAKVHAVNLAGAAIGDLAGKSMHVSRVASRAMENDGDPFGWSVVVAIGKGKAVPRVKKVRCW